MEYPMAGSLTILTSGIRENPTLPVRLHVFDRSQGSIPPVDARQPLDTDARWPAPAHSNLDDDAVLKSP